MDDRQRLVRRVSLVAWAGEPGSDACGLRFASAEDGGDVHVALWRLTSWYAGTVRRGNDLATGDTDTPEFPGATTPSTASRTTRSP
ncbi:hypothetical protein [Frankia sp. CiP3]|uniref:hypothetical protein n=1 Tax=Frankia sp. CiP3 TaxID=2880971 RepID=UPI001EF67AFA|nr:hypothetical protein [Frankia sp. CiP3]